MRVRPLTILNAEVWSTQGTERRALYTAERFLPGPIPGAAPIDLDGYTLYPGRVNAHDHLELNHYPRTKFRDEYPNAHAWGDSVNLRLGEPPFSTLRAFPLEDRLFIGGLKNLLCGATTVAHHGPPHPPMFRRDFPVRVLRRYGWAHSLHFDTDQQVVRSYRRTPRSWPWFIHLAEGADDAAAGEYERLKALGCVGENTVIVHGVGLRREDIADAAPRVRGLVWCPSTNAYLLGAAADPMAWKAHGGTVALGSDSRLTAAGDLGDEVLWANAAGVGGVGQMVAGGAAHILGLSSVGRLGAGAAADWLAAAVPSPTRAEIALIVRGGLPCIGDPALMAQFPQVPVVEAALDGVPKAVHLALARRIARCSLREPGLELGLIPKRRFYE